MSENEEIEGLKAENAYQLTQISDLVGRCNGEIVRYNAVEKENAALKAKLAKAESLLPATRVGLEFGEYVLNIQPHDRDIMAVKEIKDKIELIKKAISTNVA